MESDSDYEEVSEDPFEGQFSDSDFSDDSNDDIEIDNSLSKIGAKIKN